MLTGRDVLIYFSLKHGGDWDKIYLSIKNKDKIDENDYMYLKTKCLCSVVTIIDDNYPQCLKSAYKPPIVLYYYGNISLLTLKNRITVVGTRNPSTYGEMATIKLCEQLVDNKYIIVSGLAKGIDFFAHKSAIDKGGHTIAVLGSGIDKCYPKQNQNIYDIIKEKHLLLSEYPFDTPPEKENFPKRNRILAAIGDAVLVTECRKLNSGTNITITNALNLGKEIFCVPFPIDIANGNNLLIKDGATLIENVNDIIFNLDNKN